MTRLESLACAIQLHEGFYPGSRSFRNNNPGNLRISPYGKDDIDGFAVFSCYTVGFYALYWDLMSKCHGRTRTGLTGESTLEDLLMVWAPPSDNNNTKAYIDHVCAILNIKSDTKLKWFVEDT